MKRIELNELQAYQGSGWKDFVDGFCIGFTTGAGIAALAGASVTGVGAVAVGLGGIGCGGWAAYRWISSKEVAETPRSYRIGQPTYSGPNRLLAAPL